MTLPPLPYADWITAILTISYMQLMAMRNGWAWPLGIATQFLWIYMSVSKEMYGIVVLSLVLMAQCAYGWWNWSRPPEKEPLEMGDQ
jgi:nicotinamide riboside transporter PnuC